jgi:hypothetical protein
MVYQMRGSKGLRICKRDPLLLAKHSPAQPLALLVGKAQPVCTARCQQLHRDQREHDAQSHRRPEAKQDGLPLLFRQQAACCQGDDDRLIA